MLWELLQNPRDQAVLLLFGGCIGLLVAVLATARALIGEHDPSPSRRALAHFLPIAATALAAAFMGHSEVGIAIVFGTSVAALSTVSGFTLLIHPVEEVPPRAARVWPFLPVPATLVLLLGFRGTLLPFDAILLLAQGVLLTLIWTAHPAATEAEALPATPAEGGDQAPPSRYSPWLLLEVPACLALAAVAGLAATRGAIDLNNFDYRYPANVVAAALIGAVLVIPMVNSGAPMASAGRTWSPLTAQVGLVFLNIGLLLPLVILIPSLRPLADHYLSPAASAATQPIWPTIVYPRITWRIDSVALLVFSLIFVPAADRRVRLDRTVGPWLIVGYCLYLFSLMLLAVRGQ